MEIEKKSDVRSIRRKLKLPHFLVQNNQFENLNFESMKINCFIVFPILIYFSCTKNFVIHKVYSILYSLLR